MHTRCLLSKELELIYHQKPSAHWQWHLLHSVLLEKNQEGHTSRRFKNLVHLLLHCVHFHTYTVVPLVGYLQFHISSEFLKQKFLIQPVCFLPTYIFLVLFPPYLHLYLNQYLSELIQWQRWTRIRKKLTKPFQLLPLSMDAGCILLSTACLHYTCANQILKHGTYCDDHHHYRHSSTTKHYKLAYCAHSTCKYQNSGK